MGVISFGDDGPTWGSSASFLRGLVAEAINRVGRKDYLQHFSNLMEWGYNGLDLSELHVDELKEFSGVIQGYREIYLSDSTMSETTKISAVVLFDNLAEMLKNYIREREERGAFLRTGDLWTLKP